MPRPKILFLCLLPLLLAAGWKASFVATAKMDPLANGQDKPAINEKGSASAQAFVMIRNEPGEATCRLATPSERRQIMQRGGERQIIYSGAPRRNEAGAQNSSSRTSPKGQMPELQPSAGLRIVLHGTSQINQSQNQAARNAFIVAANRWEAIISTPVTVVLDVDFGTTYFGTSFSSDFVLGATGSEEDTRPYSEVRERLLANSPTTSETQLYNALPATTVPTQLSNKTFTSLTVRLTRANSRALGFFPDITDPNAIPLGGGDAAIGFNSAFPFDFDPNNGISADKVDFDTVATHEIAHALGFVSESGGAVYAPATVWDLFRFRPGAAGISTFATALRIMSSGGTQVYFNGQANTFGTQELRLSTGGPTGSAGDGNQSSHWKDDDLTFQYIGIMDPNIGEGERQPITNNDVNALDSFGYSIGALVPPPPQPPPAPPSAPPNDNFANAIVIQDANGATIGNSTGATKEAGEPVMLASPAGGSGGKSIWYRWTSPVNGTATFDTEGSGYDTILAVSTGSSVSGLSRLTVNDDLAPGETTSSRVTFSVTAGVTYQLAVDGFNNGGGIEVGIIELNWSAAGTSPTPTPTPTPSPSFGITGRVLDSAANGIAGVRVGIDGPNLVNGLPHLPVTTDAAGNFQFSLLTPGGNYIVRSDDLRYTFTPATVTFASISANQNVTFTAMLNLATVTGRVVENGNPLSGVLVGLFQSGVLQQQMTTGVDGRWSFSNAVISSAYDVPFIRSGYSFNPPSQIFTANQAMQDMGDVLATKGNSIDASDFFVTRHYDDFLGRAADPVGLSFWVNNIETCAFSQTCREVKRIDTSAAFFLSVEFQETGYLVYRAYQTAYGDAFDPTITTPGSPLGYAVPIIRRSEFLADTPLISQGVLVGIGNWEDQLEVNKQAFMAEFVARSRFTAAYPLTMSADQFVTKLDQNAGGVLSPFEKALLVSVLGSTPEDGGKRAQVLRAIAEDTDLKRRETSRAFVLMQYFGYLRRDPNASPNTNYSGYKFWLDKLNSFNGDFRGAEMVKAFITSGEYRGRFGP